MTSLIRKAYRLSERIAPKPSRLLRRIFHVATGRYFDHLEAVLMERLDTLRSEHRVEFENLSSEVRGLFSRRSPADWPFILNEGVQRLAKLKAASGALAVISPLPPEQTGLANFTLRTFREAGCPVDIFSRFTDTASYLALSHDASLAASGINFLPIDLLPAARVQRRYLAQVYEVGNSHHNLPVWESFAAQATFPTDIPTFVHIHDPCLLHLLRISLVTRDEDFLQTISHHYGLEKLRDDESFLIDRGVFGPRALFSGVSGVHLLTNSEAAKDLLALDWPEMRDRTHALFHPVFPSGNTAPAAPRDTIRIGTFGIPSAVKGGDTIVAAFRLLAQEIDNIELVIAGFSAASFVHAQGLQNIPSVKVFDSPSDTELLRLMQTCDVAVQLRLLNRGESSGIVPQLISLDVPVIVSQIGAFAEYRDAVSYVPHLCSAEDLAEAIRTELRHAGRGSAARRSYAASHTPEAFCKALRSYATELKSQQDMTAALTAESVQEIVEREDCPSSLFRPAGSPASASVAQTSESPIRST